MFDIIDVASLAMLLAEHFNSVIVQLPLNDIGEIKNKLPFSFTQGSNDINIESNDVNETMRILLEHNINLTNIKIRNHTLDDLFLKLTGHTLRS